MSAVRTEDAEPRIIGHLLQQLESCGSATFTVRAHPGARQTKINSVMDDGAIKIDLKAAPEDGKANDLLLVLLSKEFNVPRSNIEILSGHLSRQKVVRISI